MVDVIVIENNIVKVEVTVKEVVIVILHSCSYSLNYFVNSSDENSACYCYGHSVTVAVTIL